MIVGMGVDWNGLLEVGVPLWIAAIGSAAATIISSLNRRNSKTSNGHTLGELVEEAHGIAKDNAEKLDKLNAPTEVE